VREIRVIAVEGLPEIREGDDLAELIAAKLDLEDGDVVVFAQKAVSKAEGRVVRLEDLEPSERAREIAGDDLDPRRIEAILQEAKRVVRVRKPLVIAETRHGFICASAGVDSSNAPEPGMLVLLPLDPDASARRIAQAAHQRYGCRVAIIITDTFGRPWRQGLVDFALGVAGMPALLDLRGSSDLDGRTLKHTVAAQADALAAAAGLLMRKGDAIPAALVRGYGFARGSGSGTELLREKQFDLFR